MLLLARVAQPRTVRGGVEGGAGVFDAKGWDGESSMCELRVYFKRRLVTVTFLAMCVGHY